MPSAALTTELRGTEHALLEQARRQRLALAQKPMVVVRGAVDRIDVALLQRTLDRDDVLVEYGVNGDELLACVVTPSAVVVRRRIAHWPAVVDAVRAARFQLDTLRHGTEAVTHHLPMLARRADAHMRALHGMIWAPLAADVQGAARIVIVPHAQLGAVPFAALNDGGAPLALRHQLSYAPSAHIALHGLHGLQSEPALPQRALVMGESSRLPHAAIEAHAVGRLFPRADVFTGSAATLDALVGHAATADVIHLACHAQFRSDNPMFSALHLVDGALTVEAAESLALKAGTVVLSACETALADQGSGNEMVGLVRAFLVAGAARVLASLWPVDDRITSDFMVRFHREVARGTAPAEALRHAQQAIMEVHPHPYYWAAFTLHGRW